MSGNASAPRPETLALDTWIRAVLSRRDIECSHSAGGGVLFLAPGLHSIPVTLIRDAVLEPVDKLAWLVIFQSGTETGGGGEFPSYKTITTDANVGSSATVSRALAVLRLARWLTLVSQDNLKASRTPGNVYALHGAPLALADTLFLDTAYPEFVAKSRTHHHARVRALATKQHAVLDQHRDATPWRHTCDTFLTREPESAERLRPPRAASEVVDTLQNSKSCSSKQLQDLKTLKKTTTTPTEQRSNHSAREAAKIEGLVLPRRLTRAQHPAVAGYLADVPDGDRQAVLDELAGRLNAEQRGAKPVYDVLRYLHQLCHLARAGDFVPNLGVAVRKARDERGPMPTDLSSHAPPRSAEPSDREAGLRALAEIRESLGMSFRVNTTKPRDDSSR